MLAVFLDAASLGDSSFAPMQRLLAHWQCYERTTPDEVQARICSATVVVTNKVVIDEAAMAAAPDLRLILVAATGTNNVDLSAAQARGICVCNVAGYSTTGVAQLTMTLLLALASHFSAYHQDVQAGRWSRSPLFTFLDYPYVELAGKCLGIVGFGAIGQRVKALAEAFDMRVLVAERPGQAPRPGRLLFEQVLKSCDVLTLHCPLNEATCDLIDAAALAQMRPGSWLINVSRGGIVNESALVAALNSGHLAGAALDVLSQEPPPEDNPLLQAKHPNLLLTPHIAWASRESRARLVDELALNLQAFLQGRPRNQVA